MFSEESTEPCTVISYWSVSKINSLSRKLSGSEKYLCFNTRLLTAPFLKHFIVLWSWKFMHLHLTHYLYRACNCLSSGQNRPQKHILMNWCSTSPKIHLFVSLFFTFNWADRYGALLPPFICFRIKYFNWQFPICKLQTTNDIQSSVEADHACWMAWFTETCNQMPFIGWWVINLTGVKQSTSVSCSNSACNIDLVIHGCSKCSMPCFIHRCNFLETVIIWIKSFHFSYSSSCGSVIITTAYYVKVMSQWHSTGPPSIPILIFSSQFPLIVINVKCINCIFRNRVIIG